MNSYNTDSRSQFIGFCYGLLCARKITKAEYGALMDRLAKKYECSEDMVDIESAFTQ